MATRVHKKRRSFYTPPFKYELHWSTKTDEDERILKQIYDVL